MNYSHPFTNIAVSRRSFASMVGLGVASFIGCEHNGELHSHELEESLVKQLNSQYYHYMYDARVIAEMSEIKSLTEAKDGFDWEAAQRTNSGTQAAYSLMLRFPQWEEIYDAVARKVGPAIATATYATAIKCLGQHELDITEHFDPQLLLVRANQIDNVRNRVFILQQAVTGLGEKASLLMPALVQSLGELPSSEQPGRALDIIDDLVSQGVDPIPLSEALPTTSINRSVKMRREYYERFRKLDLEYFVRAFSSEDPHEYVPAACSVMRGPNVDFEFRHSLCIACADSLAERRQGYPYGFNSLLAVAALEDANERARLVHLFDTMRKTVATPTDILDCSYKLISRLTAIESDLGNKSLSQFYADVSNGLGELLYEQLFIIAISHCFSPTFPFVECMTRRAPELEALVSHSQEALRTAFDDTTALEDGAISSDWATRILSSDVKGLSPQRLESVLRRFPSSERERLIRALLSEHYVRKAGNIKWR